MKRWPKLAGLAFIILLAFSSLRSSNAESVIANVPVGASPTSPTVDSGNGDVYVTNSAFLANNPSVSVISGSSNAVIATVKIPGGTNSSQTPEQATFDPLNGDVYVTDGATSQVYIISASSNTIVGNLSIRNPGSPNLLFDSAVFNPSNGFVYVNNGATEFVISGGTNTIISSIKLPGEPDDGFAGVDTANGDVYFAGYSTLNRSAINVISATSLVATLYTSLSPYVGTPVFDPANNDVYVPSSPSLIVVSGSSNTIVGSIMVGGAVPTCGCSPTPVIDPDNGDLYVPISGAVDVVSGSSNSLLGNVTSTGGPDGGVFDPVTRDVYFSDQWTNNVTVIADATNTVVATLPTGPDPVTPTYDPANGDIYVASFQGNEVSVISGASATTSTTSSPVPEFSVQAIAIVGLSAMVAVAVLVRRPPRVDG